jgi:hypothetical protein
MTTQFFDLMIDIETMDNKHTAAMLSVGAVFFDLQTCTLGPTFNRTINLVSSVAHGGTMSAGTVLWWLRQGDEARKSVAYNGEPLAAVLGDFGEWIEQTCRHEDVRPWGNSASFDLGIMGSAYDRLAKPRPWVHLNERCFRTVRNLYPQIEYDVQEKGTEAHNALADAEFQARHLFKIKNRGKKA